MSYCPIVLYNYFIKSHDKVILMFSDETKNIDAQSQPGRPDKIRKAYEKPTLTRLDALDIGTGATNVPENNNGLLES